MCAAVESENGWSTKEKYLDWFGRYLAPTYPMLSAEECYKLRCSLLHQGRSAGSQYERLIFVAPGVGTFHNNILNDALNLDLPTFCGDVMSAVRKWREEVKDTPEYQRHAPQVMQWHRGGLSPYFGGVDVLA